MLELIDFIPIETEKKFLPAEEDTTFKIKRKVTCKYGVCRFTVTFKPRFNYARDVTILSHVDRGIFVQNGSMHGILISDQKFTINDRTAVAEVTLK